VFLSRNLDQMRYFLVYFLEKSSKNRLKWVIFLEKSSKNCLSVKNSASKPPLASGG